MYIILVSNFRLSYGTWMFQKPVMVWLLSLIKHCSGGWMENEYVAALKKRVLASIGVRPHYTERIKCIGTGPPVITIYDLVCT